MDSLTTLRVYLTKKLEVKKYIHQSDELDPLLISPVEIIEKHYLDPLSLYETKLFINCNFLRLELYRLKDLDKINKIKEILSYVRNSIRLSFIACNWDVIFDILSIMQCTELQIYIDNPIIESIAELGITKLIKNHIKKLNINLSPVMNKKLQILFSEWDIIWYYNNVSATITCKN